MNKHFIIGGRFNKNVVIMKVKPRKIHQMFVLIKPYRRNAQEDYL